MKRLPTIIAAASSALLTALAVAVATPASGTDDNADADDFISCVRSHGLADAPTEPLAFKRWIGERLDKPGDATIERALEACEPKGAVRKSVAMDVSEVRACLERHGAQISGDGPVDVKRWVRDHLDDPNAKDALEACHVGGPPPEGAIAGKCAAIVKPAPGDEHVKKPAPADNRN